MSVGNEIESLRTKRLQKRSEFRRMKRQKKKRATRHPTTQHTPEPFLSFSVHSLS